LIRAGSLVRHAVAVEHEAVAGAEAHVDLVEPDLGPDAEQIAVRAQSLRFADIRDEDRRRMACARDRHMRLVAAHAEEGVDDRDEAPVGIVAAHRVVERAEHLGR